MRHLLSWTILGGCALAVAASCSSSVNGPGGSGGSGNTGLVGGGGSGGTPQCPSAGPGGNCAGMPNYACCEACFENWYVAGVPAHNALATCEHCTACYSACNGSAVGCTAPATASACDEPHSATSCASCKACAASADCQASHDACTADGECQAMLTSLAQCKPE